MYREVFEKIYEGNGARFENILYFRSDGIGKSKSKIGKKNK